MQRLVLFVALGLVGACDARDDAPVPAAPASAPATTAPPVAAPTSPTPTPEVAAAPKHRCPRDTTLQGAAPPDGTEQWCARTDGTRHGAYVAYYPLGDARVQGTFDEGKEHGVWQDYFAGGRLRAERIYDRGRATGTWHTYFHDGNTATETTHVSDTDQHLTELRPDGSRLREGPLRDGARHGTWYEWRNDGTAETTEYVAGKPGKAASVATPASAAGPIGIPECDEYIEKYTQCVRDKIPAARESMEEAMAATTKAWKEAADGPAREGLVTACKAALDAAKQATRSMGCTW